MAHITSIILPIFGMAIIGFGTGKLGLFDEGVGKGLSAFVFKLAIPVMLFHTLGRLSFPEIEWRGLLVYYLATACVYLGGVLSGRRCFGMTPTESGTFAMAAAFSNTVLLALPIVLRVHGEAGTVPLLLIISVHTTFLFGIGTIYVETARAKGKGFTRTLEPIIVGLARNPIILGLVSGLLFNFSGLTLPGWLDQIARMFTRAAIPCALFAMGLSLCRFQLGGQGRQVAQLVAWKLLIHPALVLALGLLFDLDPLWRSVTVIAAAMPSGINAYLFAAGYGKKEATVAATVLLTTGLAIPTTAVLLSLTL